MMLSHPIVATAFALLLAPLAPLAPAQEVTLYSTDFTTMDGWTNTAFCHSDYIWAADATPASHFAGPYVSPPASLNFNNGVHIGGGVHGNGIITCGRVTSDPTDLSLAAGVPWLRFMASWNYEPGCDWDILSVRVRSASGGAILFQIPCLDNGEEFVPWTAFEFPLDRSWGEVRIEFEFQSIDDWVNIGTGAFIDDLSVVDVLPIFTAFCTGDGSATPCPCGNTGAPGAGCVNSTGAGSQLVASGSPAVSAGDLALVASHIQPNQFGIYFQGTSNMNGGDGVVFGDGLLCASGNLIRLQSVQGDSGGNSATTIDIALSGNAAPGDTRYYQFWYRDPWNSPCSGGFNLSNGIQITWTP